MPIKNRPFKGAIFIARCAISDARRPNPNAVASVVPSKIHRGQHQQADEPVTKRQRQHRAVKRLPDQTAQNRTDQAGVKTVHDDAEPASHAHRLQRNRVEIRHHDAKAEQTRRQ